MVTMVFGRCFFAKPLKMQDLILKFILKKIQEVVHKAVQDQPCIRQPIQGGLGPGGCIRETVLLTHPLACSTLDIKANVSKGCLAAICLAVGKEDCHGA